MSTARILSSLAASVAVAGCAVVAIGMARAETGGDARHAADVPAAVQTARPAAAHRRPARPQHPRTPHSAAPAPGAPVTVAPPSASARPAASRTHARPIPPAASTAPAATSDAPSSSAPARRPQHHTAPTRAARPAPRHTATHPTAARPATTHHSAPHRSATHQSATHHSTTHHSAREHGRSLPIHMHIGNATRVITVVARSHSSTTARLQAWGRVKSGGWRKHGSAISAHVGADGLSRHPSESRSATPIGSFTLTRAFGRDANPGTRLPYLHTTPADWWISQAGPLYNTLQVCSSGCDFNQGSPNEHLYYETPFYDYAVVIDYNTRNAPGGVHQGAGSAFFLHVTDHRPTAGCVAIPKYRLKPLMRWLRPYTHPRILIGVS